MRRVGAASIYGMPEKEPTARSVPAKVDCCQAKDARTNVQFHALSGPVRRNVIVTDGVIDYAVFSFIDERRIGCTCRRILASLLGNDKPPRMNADERGSEVTISNDVNR